MKINLAFTWLGVNNYQFFDPLHTPVGALLIAGIIAVSFKDARKAFIPLGIGVSTHFILDFFLVDAHSSMLLLYPFSWSEWQYYVIRNDENRITIVAVLAALLTYAIYWYHEKKRNRSKQGRRETESSPRKLKGDSNP